MPRRSTKHVGSGQHLSINPDAVARMELLIASRVMDLRAISEVVSGDAGLMAHMIQTLKESDQACPASPTVNECVIELGREGMRRCLRTTRLYSQAPPAQSE